MEFNNCHSLSASAKITVITVTVAKYARVQTTSSTGYPTTLLQRLANLTARCCEGANGASYIAITLPPCRDDLHFVRARRHHSVAASWKSQHLQQSPLDLGHRPDRHLWF
jgi:hypothetical protein